MREHDAHLMCRNGATPRYIFHVEHHDDFCVLQIFIEFCSHLRLQFQLQVFDWENMLVLMFCRISPLFCRHLAGYFPPKHEHADDAIIYDRSNHVIYVYLLCIFSIFMRCALPAAHLISILFPLVLQMCNTGGSTIWMALPTLQFVCFHVQWGKPVAFKNHLP